MEEKFRTFPSWSTRDTSNWKLEYANYIHPLADYDYAEYMKSKQIIGWQYRRWDNWQKWIPEESCFDSLVRHVEILKLLKHWFDVYELEKDWNIDWIVVKTWESIKTEKWTNVYKKDIKSELNAIRFNSEAMKLYYLDWWYNL